MGEKLRPRERAKNWWHYHKVAVLLIALCLIAAAILLRGIFAREKPDLCVGYVATEPLPPGAAETLEEALAELCGDVNGDGRAEVELEQFALDFNAGADYRNMDERMAGITLLTGSIYAADGANIFLMEDPEGFQRRTGALQYLDGSLPNEANDYDAANWRRMTVPWADSKLKGMELEGVPSEKLERLSLGLCAPSPRDDRRMADATQRLWQTLTGNAGGR